MPQWLWRVLQWALFRLDAERAHRMALFWVQLGTRFGGFLLRWCSGSPQISITSPAAQDAKPNNTPPTYPNVFGLPFLSHVGLAAGFDKNAETLTALPDLGFGFAEIGTVTPRPQPGNLPPRLFRNPTSLSLFNCMGFNNDGAKTVAQRVANAKHRLPPLFRIGINLGKNKDTRLENAAQDYEEAAIPFENLADYLVINLSSPNTPGLRSLQTLENLKPILTRVLTRIQKWKNPPPLLLKLAPELRGESLRELLRGAESLGASGWVLTNTRAGQWTLSGEKTLTGGWSGGILTEDSRSVLKEARSISSKPILSVGGILSLEEARSRLRAGADLIQIYTGWIFRGPTFPAELARSLDQKKLKTA